MDTSKISNFIKSKTAVIIIAGLFALAILIGTFSAGVAVGYRKARFSYAWGENYHRNFSGPRKGFLKDFSEDLMGRDFIGAHGTFGSIINIGDSELIVRGRDNVEKIVVVNSDTDIRRFRDSIQLNDIKLDEPIVVIGEPNDQGQIEAKFIRVMPLPVRSLGEGGPFPSNNFKTENSIRGIGFSRGVRFILYAQGRHICRNKICFSCH
jgi:hypothetical protein